MYRLTATSYFPSMHPQLTGLDSESVDCGVRATQTAIDDATKGRVVPSVKQLRKRMGKPGRVPTGPTDWLRAFTSYDTPDELKGKFDSLIAYRERDWSKVAAHLRGGGGAIVAVAYDTLRHLQPNKVGSETFSGYHAIFFKGWRAGKKQVRSTDSLLDGRRRGIPKGPLWLKLEAVKKSALKVAQREGVPGNVFVVLTYPAVKLGQGVDELTLPPEETGVPCEVDTGDDPTMSDILSDLYGLSESCNTFASNGSLSAPAREELLRLNVVFRDTLSEFTDALGFDSDADSDDEPEDGLQL